jgi:hypothetical protein
MTESFGIQHLTFSSPLGTGAVAQLGEHLLCKQGVVGSIPISSTMEPISQAAEWSRREISGGCNRKRLPPASIFAIERSLTIEYGL